MNPYVPPNRLPTVYEDIRRLCRDGDNAVFRNEGLVQRTSVGPASHIGKLLWLRDENGRPMELMLCEQREFRGGRMVTLSSQIRACPGRVDIYRPKCRRETALLSAHFVARQAGHPYGWGSIGRAFLVRLNLIRAITGWSPDVTDLVLSDWYERKHCAQTVGWAERKAAWEMGDNFDPCPNKNDKFIEPNDLTGAAHERMFCNLVLSSKVRKR